MPERKPRTRVHAYALLGSAGVAALLSGCAENAPQDTWKPKGENAQKIQDLQWPVFLVAGVVGVIVMVVVAILAAIAVPSYHSFILKSHRDDAKVALAALQMAHPSPLTTRRDADF